MFHVFVECVHFLLRSGSKKYSWDDILKMVWDHFSMSQIVCPQKGSNSSSTTANTLSTMTFSGGAIETVWLIQLKQRIVN